jgi:hypothetical protein
MNKNNTEQQVQLPKQVFDEMVKCIADARNLFNDFLMRQLESDAFDDKEERNSYAMALTMLENAEHLSKSKSHET